MTRVCWSSSRKRWLADGDSIFNPLLGRSILSLWVPHKKANNEVKHMPNSHQKRQPLRLKTKEKFKFGSSATTGAWRIPAEYMEYQSLLYPGGCEIDVSNLRADQFDWALVVTAPTQQLTSQSVWLQDIQLYHLRWLEVGSTAAVYKCRPCCKYN